MIKRVILTFKFRWYKFWLKRKINRKEPIIWDYIHLPFLEDLLEIDYKEFYKFRDQKLKELKLKESVYKQKILKLKAIKNGKIRKCRLERF